MNETKDKRFYLMAIILFVCLNILNTLMVTVDIFNPGMNLYKKTLLTAVNSFLGNLGFLLILLGLILLIVKNKRGVVVTLTVFTGILSVSILLLKIYSVYYNTAFSFFNARTFTNSAPVLGKQLARFVTKNFIKMGQYIALIPFFGMLTVMIVMFSKDKLSLKKLTSFYKRRLKPALIVLIIGLSSILVSVVNFNVKIKASSHVTHIETLKGYQSMGVYPYVIKDFIDYISTNPHEVVVDEELKQRANIYLNNFKDPNNLNFFNENTNNSNPLFEGKNLLILQMESFNNFLINLEITDPETNISYEITPFINSLVNSNNNLYYDRFYSNIGVGKTSDAEFAVNTGLVPTGDIVSYYDHIHDDYETIAKLFNKKGYKSSILTGSTESFYRRNDVYPDLGYLEENYYNEERYFNEGRFNPERFYYLENGKVYPHEINGWVNDYIVFDQIIDILNDRNQTHYLFAESTVLHTPFADNEYITNVNEWSHIYPTQIGNYFDYAYFFDQAVKYLFFQLEKYDLLKDTIIFMYGDHKSDLFIDEHRHLPQFENMDTMMFNKIAHNVPLIVVADSFDLSAYNNSTSLIRGQNDIKRTVSNLFDLKPTYYFGVDILTTDKTVTYVPITKDFFTDEFHLNLRTEEADIELDIELLENYIYEFYILKENNDLLVEYNFFNKNEDDS